jgi:hypothetical protein|tara:strand:- start:1471 stop:1620 length:150 start_codon:yes stop_codon:yes gene_type:complete
MTNRNSKANARAQKQKPRKTQKPAHSQGLHAKHTASKHHSKKQALSIFT